MGSWSLHTPSTAIDLADLSVAVRSGGGGMPPVRHIAPGNVFQESQTEPRSLTLVLTARQRRAMLPALRTQLISVLTAHSAVITLRYAGSARTLELACQYIGGLEDTPADTDTLEVGFIAYPPGLWVDTGASTVNLTVQASLSAIGYLLERPAGGVWRELSGGPSISVGSIVTTADGTRYLAETDGAQRVWRFTTAWADLGSPGDTARALVTAVDGTLYAGGSFGVKVWNGSSWANVGTIGGTVVDLAFGPDGQLYAASSAPGYVKVWNGSSWATVGSGPGTFIGLLRWGMDDRLYAVAPQSLYRWDTTSWATLTALTPSNDYDDMRSLAFDAQGNLIFGGDAAVFGWHWNGVIATSLGLDGMLTSVIAGRNSQLHLAGEFAVIDGIALPGLATWNGSVFLGEDIRLTNRYPDQLAISPDGTLTLGCSGFGTGSAVTGAITSVTNPGSTVVYPVLTITGPGELVRLAHLVRDEILAFDNLILLSGETITLDLSARTLTSSFRGDLFHKILPGSRFPGLNAGSNDLSLLITDASATASLHFLPRYHSWEFGDVA